MSGLRRFAASVAVLVPRRYLHSYPATGCSFLWNNKETRIHQFNSFYPTNNFHVVCNSCFAKQKGQSGVFETDVRLLDANGRELGLFTKRKVVDISIEKDFQLILVSKPDTGIPTYQLMTKERVAEFKAQGKAQGKEQSEKKTKAKSPPQRKILTIKSSIEDQSLDIKLKSLDKWFGKGKRVQITINNVVPGSNKDLIRVSRKIREKLEDKAEVYQLKTTNMNMILTVQPKVEEKTAGTAAPPLFKTEELREMRQKEKSDIISGDKTDQ